MSAIKNYYADEIEQRSVLADCINENEFFEYLDEAGIGEISWSESLNNQYATWQYLNIK